MAVWPNPEELYPDWRDWARVLGRYLIDEEMERRRDISQRLGRFFISYSTLVISGFTTNMIYTARAPFKVISCSNSWFNTTFNTASVTLRRVVPPSTTANLEWEHGNPTGIIAPETASPGAIHAVTKGLCTLNSEITADGILEVLIFNTVTLGRLGLTIEAEDLSWNL